MSLDPNSYVDVYIWRARDKEGYVTTSSEGARLEKESERGSARVGHAALEVVKDSHSTYMSLWPNVHGIGTQKSVLVNDFQEEKDKYEGSDPDVIVRLHRLNIDQMLTAFQDVKKRVEAGELAWDWHVSDSADTTDPTCKTASCVSFVWTMLKKGKIDDSKSYKEYWSKRGPKNSEFYKILKCHLAQRFWGLFDGIFWTDNFFSPYALLLRVGSAAEGVPLDKEKTIEIMESDRVTETKERGWGWGDSMKIGGVSGATAVVGLSAIKK